VVSSRALILNQMKETSDELTALKARSHGAAHGKRKKLRRRSAELEGRLVLLICQTDRPVFDIMRRNPVMKRKVNEMASCVSASSIRIWRFSLKSTGRI